MTFVKDLIDTMQGVAGRYVLICNEIEDADNDDDEDNERCVEKTHSNLVFERPSFNAPTDNIAVEK